jgi:hypothetical protein
MTKLDIASIGIWGPGFANWQEFSNGLSSGFSEGTSELKPTVISPRERRRAPQSVKLAAEVMQQACATAALDPTTIATVFSSSMGDMDITDYMCDIVGKTPRGMSPTKFHNSVHNAASGYWSIATQSHQAATAISAFGFTASMAFVEAAIQTVEEKLPVLVVCQEMKAPTPFREICPSSTSFSTALLLTPDGFGTKPLAHCEFSIDEKSARWPSLPTDLQSELTDNFGARLLPLLAAIAQDKATSGSLQCLEFPINEHLCLSIKLNPS